jgi:very-short-patch-repair endonuclease
MLPAKTCPRCHTQFNPKASEQKFCGLTCARQSQADARNVRVTLACQYCGQPFKAKRTKADARFCSRTCQGAARTQLGHVTLTCKVCGKSFERKASRTGDYCSYECMGADKHKRTAYACHVCGQTFEAKASKTQVRYCSRECKYVGSLRRFTLVCEACGKPFEVHKERVGVARFCSWQCYKEASLPYFRDTAPELAVREVLDQLGILYKPQHPIDKFRIDFYLPVLHIALEVDGIYWHSLPGRAEYDAERDTILRSLNVAPVHITDQEIAQTTNLSDLVLDRLKISS